MGAAGEVLVGGEDGDEEGEDFCETEIGSHGDRFGESGSRSFVLLKGGSVGVLKNEVLR